VVGGVSGTLVAVQAIGPNNDLANPLMQTTFSNQDLNGRPTTVTLLPANSSVTLVYDANGNVKSVTPPTKPAHFFQFDSMDREIGYTPPAVDGGVMSTFSSYDPLGRPLSIDDPSGLHTVYGWNQGLAPNGHLDSIVTPVNRKLAVYDTQTKRLTSVTNQVGSSSGGSSDVVLTYGYNDDPSHFGTIVTNVSSTGYVAGAGIQRGFDNNVWLNSEIAYGPTGLGSGYEAVPSRDNGGALISLLTKRAGATVATLARTVDHDTALPSLVTVGSLTESFSWNIFGEAASYTVMRDSSPIYGAVYDTVSLPRDFLGRIQRRTETVGGNSVALDYAYDPAGRLAMVTGGTQPEQYTYDANGNRTSAVANGVTITSSSIYYDEQDRLRKYGTTTYTYSPAGNRASRTDSTGNTSYTYDAVGNLTAVQCTQGTCGSLTAGNPITYLVDGRNRRVARLKNGICTNKWIWSSQLRIAAELDCATNAVTKRFVYGEKTNVPELIVTPTAVFRVITDQLGSVRIIFNLATNDSYEVRYLDSFGTIDPNSSAIAGPTGLPGLTSSAGYPIPFGFAGGFYDADTKLTRFGARDYDPQIGQWITKDPSRMEGGPNLYSYCYSDPINLVDRTGLRPGKHYNSADLAAIDAIGDISSTSRKEFGGWIYAKKGKDGTYWYSYTKPKAGTEGKFRVPNASVCPSGTEPVGDYHTHGPADGSFPEDGFSGPDDDPSGNGGDIGGISRMFRRGETWGLAWLGTRMGDVMTYIVAPDDFGPNQRTIARGVR